MSSHPLNVFVSSVQKELENERAVTELVASDPFLGRRVRQVFCQEVDS